MDCWPILRSNSVDLLAQPFFFGDSGIDRSWNSGVRRLTANRDLETCRPFLPIPVTPAIQHAAPDIQLSTGFADALARGDPLRDRHSELPCKHSWAFAHMGLPPPYLIVSLFAVSQFWGSLQAVPPSSRPPPSRRPPAWILKNGIVAVVLGRRPARPHRYCAAGSDPLFEMSRYTRGRCPVSC